MKHPVQDV